MDFRNDELLRANGISLKELAEKTAHENEAMLAMAGKVKTNSKTIKIATVVATIYLSITAVTVCFLPYQFAVYVDLRISGIAVIL